MISRGLSAAVIATLIAWALIGPKPAAAETTSPDPSTSPVVAEALALPIEGEVRDLTFPTANLDGSVTEEGTVITLKADVFFAYNRATLTAKAKAALGRAAARVTELQATTVRVSGALALMRACSSATLSAGLPSLVRNRSVPASKA